MSRKKQKPQVKGKKTELQEAVDVYRRQLDVEQQTRNTDVNALHNLISEYVDTYMLVGYDITGTPIKMFSTKTLKDEAAIQTLMTEFITGLVTGNNDNTNNED